MSKINSQYEEVKEAIKAARSVERSHEAHHSALMALMVACAKEGANYLSMISEYATNRVEESKESLCTLSTFRWFEDHFGIRINDQGEARRGRDFDRLGFTPATFEKARQRPWYTIAKELAFKVPTDIAWSGAASTAVKIAHATGTELPSKDEVYAAFMEACKKAGESNSFKKWAIELKHRKEQEQNEESETGSTITVDNSDDGFGLMRLAETQAA
jgi:hypothetical protein